MTDKTEIHDEDDDEQNKVKAKDGAEKTEIPDIKKSLQETKNENDTLKLDDNSENTLKPDDNKEEDTLKPDDKKDDTLKPDDNKEDILKPDDNKDQLKPDDDKEEDTLKPDDDKEEDTLKPDDNKEVILKPDDSNKDTLKPDSDNGNSEDTETHRKAMIEEIIILLAKNEKIKKENDVLQNKLSTTFFNKPTDKLNFQEINLPIGADENTYKTIQKTIDDISKKTDEFSGVCEDQYARLKQMLREKEANIIELSKHFSDIKESTALRAVNSATGERFEKENVRRLLEKEEERNKDMLKFRLKSIRENRALKKAFDRKRVLATAEGALNFADFETMVTELENNKVKIPRVRKEVEALEKRCRNIINVMSHLAQKLHFVQAEKSTAEVKTKIMVDEVNKMRKTLFQEKTQYDKMKAENEELQHKFILLQHPELIEDFKDAEVQLKEDTEKLDNIKNIFSETKRILSTKNFLV